jgi:hypothetical protein
MRDSWLKTHRSETPTTSMKVEVARTLLECRSFILLGIKWSWRLANQPIIEELYICGRIQMQMTSKHLNS